MSRISLESGQQVSLFRATVRQRELRTRDGFRAHGIIGRSMRKVAAGIGAGLAVLMSAAPAFGQSRADNGAARAAGVQPPTTQIIVKWRDGTASTASTLVILPSLM